jgi:transcriptional regulator with XRE-family HTH domain
MPSADPVVWVRDPGMEDHDDSLEAADRKERNARSPNPVDAHVGRRVRLRRTLLGMSQEKLGEHLGLTFQQVQKYEKGINRIGASRLFELADVLSVPVQFFFDEAPAGMLRSAAANGLAEPAAESYVVEFLSTREGLELNKAFARISDPKVRRSIVELVRSIGGESNAAA